VWDLRARDTWPPGLRLIVLDEWDRPESVVRVEYLIGLPVITGCDAHGALSHIIAASHTSVWLKGHNLQQSRIEASSPQIRTQATPCSWGVLMFLGRPELFSSLNSGWAASVTGRAVQPTF